MSVAANGSLPGDALYVVKTSINEPVRAALSLSAEAKAKTEASLAVERITELEKLALRGKIDAEVNARLQNAFRAYAEAVQARMERLDAEARAEVAAEFETSLKTHASILARIRSTDNDDKKELNELATRVNAALNGTLTIRTVAEAEAASGNLTDLEPRAEGKKRAAENKLAEARKYIESAKGRAEASVVANAEAKLAAANQTFASAEAKLQADAYAEAFLLFAQAHREAQEAKEMVEFDNELEINIEIGNDGDNNNGGTTPPANNGNSGGSGAGVEGEVEIDAGSNGASGGGRIDVGL